MNSHLKAHLNILKIVGVAIAKDLMPKFLYAMALFPHNDI